MGLIYRNIEAERIRSGLKRAELAEMAGVTLKTYQNWIRNKTDIPSSKVRKLGEILNTTTDYLLIRFDEKKCS